MALLWELDCEDVELVIDDVMLVVADADDRTEDRAMEEERAEAGSPAAAEELEETGRGAEEETEERKLDDVLDRLESEVEVEDLEAEVVESDEDMERMEEDEVERLAADEREEEDVATAVEDWLLETIPWLTDDCTLALTDDSTFTGSDDEDGSGRAGGVPGSAGPLGGCTDGAGGSAGMSPSCACTSVELVEPNTVQTAMIISTRKGNDARRMEKEGGA